MKKNKLLVKTKSKKYSIYIGFDIIKKHGGQTITIPLTPDFSSSNIIDKIKNS